MKSHELAKLLLSLPDLPISTHANNQTYSGMDSGTMGDLKVGLLKHYKGNHLIIGNISKKNLNGSNWYISEMYHGDVFNEWKPFIKNMEW